MCFRFYGELCNAIVNEIHDLSARAKFTDAHFQSPLLIMSTEIVRLPKKWIVKRNKRFKQKKRAKSEHAAETEEQMKKISEERTRRTEPGD